MITIWRSAVVVSRRRLPQSAGQSGESSHLTGAQRRGRPRRHAL